MLIPKEHFSFSMSFTSVDEVLSRHNGAGLFSRDPLLGHLVDELEHRGSLYSPAKRQFEQTSHTLPRPYRLHAARPIYQQTATSTRREMSCRHRW